MERIKHYEEKKDTRKKMYNTSPSIVWKFLNRRNIPHLKKNTETFFFGISCRSYQKPWVHSKKRF